MGKRAIVIVKLPLAFAIRPVPTSVSGQGGGSLLLTLGNVGLITVETQIVRKLAPRDGVLKLILQEAARGNF